MTATTALARCTAELACPWRWRTGPPRICPLHADSDGDLAARMTAMGVDPAAAPAGRHNDGPGRIMPAPRA